MLAEKMRYYKGSENSRECVEVDEVRSDGMYITTCVVDMDLLLCGISVFPCGNGNDLKLSSGKQLEILELVKAERKKITDSYPIKTYKGWHESGLRTFEQYCFPGDTVDEETVNYFINSVPPVMFQSDCTQAGEAYSSEKDPETGQFRSTYITFSRLEACLWRFEGYCFRGSTVNRVTRPTRLEERIKETRRELENYV